MDYMFLVWGAGGLAIGGVFGLLLGAMLAAARDDEH